MDERYRTIYSAIYGIRTGSAIDTDPELVTGISAWARRPRDDQLADPVREAIDAAERTLPPARRLREDAKALLAVNFQDLVLVPLRLGGRIDDIELREAITADITTLVRNSDSSGPGAADENEISGHNIIDSLSRNWGNLRVSRFRLWEQT